MRENFSIGVFVFISSAENPNEILLVRHNYGERKWSLPGGGIGQGELVIEAAKREVKGESGLDINIGRLIGVFSLRKSKGIVFLLEGRVLENSSKQLCPLAKEEIAECRFVDLSFIPKEKIYPAQLGLIKWAGLFTGEPIYNWLIPALAE